MSKTVLDALGAELGEFFAPLVDAAEDPDWLSSLLDALGSAPDDPAGAAVATTAEAVRGVLHEIETIAAAQSPSFADIASLLESARNAVVAVQLLEASGADATAGLAGLGTDVIDLLTGIYVAGKSVLLYRLAALLLVVDAPEDIVSTDPVVVGGKIARDSVRLPRFHPDRIAALIRDPAAQLESEYLNPLATDADASAMADKLFPRVRDVLRAANVLCRYGVTPEELALLGDGAPYVDHALTVWVAEEIRGATADAGLDVRALAGDARRSRARHLTVRDDRGRNTGRKVGDRARLTADVDALAIGRRGTVLAASTETTSIDGKFPPSRRAGQRAGVHLRHRDGDAPRGRRCKVRHGVVGRP